MQIVACTCIRPLSKFRSHSQNSLPASAYSTLTTVCRLPLYYIIHQPSADQRAGLGTVELVEVANGGGLVGGCVRCRCFEHEGAHQGLFQEPFFVSGQYLLDCCAGFEVEEERLEELIVIVLLVWLGLVFVNWLLVTFLRISWTSLTSVTETSMTRWGSCLLVLSWCMVLAVVSVAIDNKIQVKLISICHFKGSSLHQN